MDDLFGFLADRIAQGIKASREADAQQRRIAEAIASPSPPQSGGNSVTRVRPASRIGAAMSQATAAPATAVPGISAPAYVAASPERARGARPTRVALDDAFPTTLEATLGARLEPANSLLRAFAGGNALLSALVLSEALAPPVALRNEPPHRP